MKTLLFSLSLFFALNSFHLKAANFEVGKIPPVIDLSGEKSDGALVKGGPWSTSALKNKVHAVFYVDPDRKDDNKALEEALNKEKFSRKVFDSVAIINLDATWLPNGIIEKKLKAKQEEFPLTIYVKDFKKVFVKQWGIEDNAYVVMIFDKKGKALYKKAGKLDEYDIDDVIQLIKKNL